MKTWLQKFVNTTVRFLFESKDTIRLDAFRVATGLCLLIYMAERWSHAPEWLSSRGFHVSAENLPFHPVYVPLLPEGLLPWFGLILFGGIFALIFGWQLKWTTWIVLVSFSYVTLADQISAFTLNKLLIVSLAVLAIARKGSHWSLDKGQNQKQSVWPIRILQATFILQYFLSGWAKVIYGDWLTDPNVLFSVSQGYYRTEFAAWLLVHLPMSLWTLMQWSAILFELLVPILFIVKPLRKIGFIWGGIMQVLIALIMHKFILFMLVMFSYYVLFFPNNWLHTFRNLSLRLSTQN